MEKIFHLIIWDPSILKPSPVKEDREVADEEDLYWEVAAIRSLAVDEELEDARELLIEDLAKEIFRENEEDRD